MFELSSGIPGRRIRSSSVFYHSQEILSIMEKFYSIMEKFYSVAMIALVRRHLQFSP